MMVIIHDRQLLHLMQYTCNQGVIPLMNYPLSFCHRVGNEPPLFSIKLENVRTILNSVIKIFPHSTSTVIMVQPGLFDLQSLRRMQPKVVSLSFFLSFFKSVNFLVFLGPVSDSKC